MKRVLIPLFVASLSMAATPPPSPPPLQNTTLASPSPSPTPTEIPGVQSLFQTRPHGSPSPPVPQRVGISGVWELALQRGPNTTYVHLSLHQEQNALTGTYLDSDNKRAPAVGIVDGTNVRVVVTYPNGQTLVFEGTLDGTTDMIGLLTTSDGQVPFSADYRPKENFFDNINENPGGLENPFPSPPPR